MRKKKILRYAFAVLLVTYSHWAYAQGVSVSTTGNDADPSAMLDVNSTTQGMLVPRMTAAQRGLIASAATGLLVYQTDGVKGFYFYDGSAWISLNAYTNVTTQGNAFNGNTQLVQTDGTGALPAISGANLTNLNFLPLAGGSMNDGANIAAGTGTGTKIGTGTTQKIGFYGAGPVAQQSGDVTTALSNLGLVSSPSISATTNANMTGDVTSVGNATSYNNKVPLSKGGTNNDLSATGGPGSYLKQTTAGGAVTVGTISAGDIPTLDQNTTGNAATVTTNADLSGPLSSSGNTTSVTSQTGTGTKFVMDASPTITSPTLVTPALGVATGTSLTLSSTLNEAQGANIASATTTDIGAATGNYINVTGSATITGLGTAQAGTRRTVTFKGAATLTYNATSLILPGAANITTAAEDAATFISLGSSNWKCVNYSPAAGSGGGGGAVSSVSNSDGTLTISPTTGAVVGSLALGHANTWTGKQTFVAPVLGAATGTSINNITMTAPATGSTLTIDDGVTLHANGNATVSGTNTGDQVLPLMFSSSFLTPTGSATNNFYPIATFMATSTSAGAEAASLANIAEVQTEFPVGFTLTKMTVMFVPEVAITSAAAPVFTLYDGTTATTLTNIWTSTTYAVNSVNAATVTAATAVTVTTSSKLSLMFNNGANGKISYVSVTFYGHW